MPNVSPGFLIAALALVVAAPAQTQTPTFRGRTDLIPVDVSVVDKKYQPVRGLTAADFTVTEDGRPQQIQVFAAIDLPAATVVSGAPWIREVESDAVTNTAARDQRLIVIVIDDAMAPSEPAMVSSTKAIANSTIDRLGPDDLAAVVFTRNGRHNQMFTHDAAALRTAVAAFQPAGHDPSDWDPVAGELMQVPFYMNSLTTLESVARVLGSLPDRRKAVIWVSVGVPASIDGLMDPTSPMHALYDRVRDCITRAAQGNVNVYAVDPSGLDGMRMYLQRRIQADPPKFRPANLTGPDQQSDRAALYSRLVQTITGDTGGRAFINSNEFASKVDAIFAETGSFYLLGYAPTNTKTDGLFRKIRVKVNGKDMTVHARGGYYAMLPVANAQAAVMSALAGLVPDVRLPLTMSMTPFADSNGGAIAVTVSAMPPDGAGVQTLDVVTAAFTEEGKQVQSSRVQAAVTPGAAAVPLQVLSRLTVPPGRFQVRAAVSSTTSGISGSVYGDVVVPDFSAAALTLSGIALVVSPAPPSAPADAFRGWLPGPPLARRELLRSEQVEAFVTLIRGRLPTSFPQAVAMHIVGVKGSTLWETSIPVAAGAFDQAQSLTVSHLLPLSTLSNGEYLLTADATVDPKKPAARSLRFTVK